MVQMVGGEEKFNGGYAVCDGRVVFLFYSAWVPLDNM